MLVGNNLNEEKEHEGHGAEDVQEGKGRSPCAPADVAGRRNHHEKPRLVRGDEEDVENLGRKAGAAVRAHRRKKHGSWAAIRRSALASLRANEKRRSALLFGSLPGIRLGTCAGGERASGSPRGQPCSRLGTEEMG